MVTATVPENTNIQGGEELYVPVKVKYVNDKGEVHYETVKAQFLARTPEVDDAVVDHSVETEIPFKSKEVFDETLPLGTIVVESEGTPGTGRVDFKQNVVNGQKGIIDENGTFIPGDDKFFVDKVIVTEPVDRLIKVGVKPVEEKIAVPKTVEYIVDGSLKPGEEVVLEEGNDGEVTVKTSKNKDTGAIEITKTETTVMKPMKVKIGAYEHENDVPFETKVEFDDTMAAGEQKVTTPGVVGKTKTKVTPPQLADMDEMMKDIGEENFHVPGSTDNEINYDAIANWMIEKGYWDKDLYSKKQVTDPNYPDDPWTEAEYDGKPLEELLDFDEKNPPTGKILVPGKVETKTITEKQDKVIKVGTKTEGEVVDEDEIPFDYDVEFDPDFYTNYPDAKGNYKIVTPGQVGKNKKTWKIVNSQIVGEPTVEKTEPTNAVIKVGQKDFTGTFETVDKDPIPFETKYQIDKDMDPNADPVIVQKGELGEQETTTTHTIKNGEVTKSEKGEAKQTKAPKEQIVKIGAKTDGVYTYTEKLPFEVEVTYDPSLKSGEYVVDQEGQPGEIKKTLVIENSEVKGNPIVGTKNEKDPVNAKIRVGSKDFTGEVTHTESHEVPFEVKVIYDDTLEVGTTIKEKEGKKGSYDLTYTQKIKNGAPEGESTTEKSNEVAAENAVIRVGTKKVTKEVEIPFNTEYEINKDLAPGTVQEKTPGKNGKKVIEVTFDQETGKAVSNETDTQATNRVVEIGPAVTNGTHEIIEDVPFEVEVKYDESVPKGEWKYAEDAQGNKLTGKKGSQKRILTIENSVVTNTSDPVQTKAPEKAVILVGSKDLTGMLEYVDKDKVPFETEVTIDPSLKPNEIVEDQAGVLGETETKVTRTITNGQAGEEVRGETTQTKAPVNRKIRIGAKSDGTHTYTNKKPFDVEIRVNPELKKGEHKVVREGVAGEEEYTVTIENSKVTKTSEPKETKAPVNEIIEVGSEDFTGEITHKNTSPLPFETEVIYDENLEAGTRVVDQEGKPGSKTTETTYKIKNGAQDGEPTTKEISKTDAVNRKVRIGIKPITKVVEIPFDTEYEADPTLKSGEIKEVTQGANGKKTITTKFNKETGKLVVTEEDTQATNRKVKVGTKTDGTHTYTEEIPFKVIVKEDPNLEAGKTREEGGTVGKKEVTVTIENSKVVGDPVEKTVTAAVDKIIYVGTKPTEDMCPVPENPTEPGEEDPNKPGTGDENPETPGKEDPNKPGTGDEDPETPGKEDPDKPGTGEDPEAPGTEDPIKPGTGEDSEKPGKEEPTKPGTGEDPETPGKEEPTKPGTGDEDPEKPGTEDPTKPSTGGIDSEKPGQNNLKESAQISDSNKEADKQVNQAAVLPKTGVAETGIFTAASLAILSGLGLVSKKEDDEA